MHLSKFYPDVEVDSKLKQLLQSFQEKESFGEAKEEISTRREMNLNKLEKHNKLVNTDPFCNYGSSSYSDYLYSLMKRSKGFGGRLNFKLLYCLNVEEFYKLSIKHKHCGICSGFLSSITENIFLSIFDCLNTKDLLSVIRANRYLYAALLAYLHTQFVHIFKQFVPHWAMYPPQLFKLKAQFYSNQFIHFQRLFAFSIRKPL